MPRSSIPERTGYPSPLAFVRNLRPGVVHPLQDIPAEAIGKLNDVLFPPAGVVVDQLDHYTLYQGPLAAGTAGSYTLAGAGTPIAKLIPTREYGVIGLDTSALAADHTTLRQEGYTIKYAADKTIVYAAKLNLADVDTTHLLVGLCVTTDDFVPTLPTAGLFFTKDATSTKLTFHVRNAGASSTQEMDLDLTDNTDIVVALRVKQGAITPYIKTASAESWVEGSGVANTDANIPATTAELLQHVSIHNGTAAVSNLQLDWQYVSKDAYVTGTRA